MNVPPPLFLNATTFALTQLDLYNWGAFAGRHSTDIDLRGTAIIGPTGSGKTTLVDALMTLITANPRYNLASTGGHESDRDLISYVRGVSGAGNNSGGNEHIARTGKTMTGIAAAFSDGARSLRLAAIFWIDDTSSATSDLKRLWIYADGPTGRFDDWLEAHHVGGARALKQISRDEPGTRVTASKQDYLAHVRRYFEVGDNAFTLLNRAAGLKQLNSIDEVFRELVLEDASAFNRALEVANEFDDLAAIHGELEVARRQQLSLKPIGDGFLQRHRIEAQVAEKRQLLRILPVWFADQAYRLAGEQLQTIGEELITRLSDVQSLSRRFEMQSDYERVLRDQYLQSGGASVEQLNQQIQQQLEIITQRRKAGNDYQRIVQRLGLDCALRPEVFERNQAHARALTVSLTDALANERAEAWTLGAAHQGGAQALRGLRQELERVRLRPSSNIPGAFQSFRSDLAVHLRTPDDTLPFVAELIEVQGRERAWRGAIERAVGGHRLRVMVPAGRLHEALTWVNDRDNHLHVRLLEAEIEGALAVFLHDGFTRKLNYKKHPFAEPLKRFLAGIDRHCVASSDELRGTAHAMTEQGLMSDRRGLFEKQDQRRLDADWMTGFDNQDRLRELLRLISEAEQQSEIARHAYDAAKKRADDTESTLNLMSALIEASFITIDLPGAEHTLDLLKKQLAALVDPQSDLERARLAWVQAQASRDEIDNLRQKLQVSVALLEDRRGKLQIDRDRAFGRIGAGLTEPERALAEQHLSLEVDELLDRLSELENQESRVLHSAIERLDAELHAIDQRLIRQMAEAKRIDTGALNDVGTEIEDIASYLERLRQLSEEALPDKLQRFLDYLNQSSDQGVTQLLSNIENEVSMIEERVGDLNRTLRRVDFHPGRFLQLEPQRIVHESLRTLQAAQRQLRTAALRDDQGETHFRALQRVVDQLRDAGERKTTVGARALLDPRYRLHFSVAVVDRDSGAVIEVRTGSQGGSGGEKEIIASYVLTASLSYALCPVGSDRPLFGTVVLDEAFSKSSQAVAGRIISALREFGLRPLFVTPNKELRLLRNHTRSAILIHRKGASATMTSLSWEDLEQYARQRSGGHNEVPR